MTEDRAPGADAPLSSLEPPDGRPPGFPAGRPPDGWTPGSQSSDRRDIRGRLAFYETIANSSPEDIVAMLDIDSGTSRMRAMVSQIENEKGRSQSIPCDSNDDALGAFPEPFEVSGSIKWFDVSRGFGFIIPDDGLPDVLLHVTALRTSGFTTAFEGARIHALAIRRPKGAQVFKILTMDDSTAIHPSTIQQRTHVIVAVETGWELATIKWFNRVRGFGFLRTKSGIDVFIHIETMRRFGLTELRPDQQVEVRYGYGSKGAMAAEVRPNPVPQGWPYLL